MFMVLISVITKTKEKTKQSAIAESIKCDTSTKWSIIQALKWKQNISYKNSLTQSYVDFL